MNGDDETSYWGARWRTDRERHDNNLSGRISDSQSVSDVKQVSILVQLSKWAWLVN